MYKISGKNLKTLIPILKNEPLNFPIAMGILDGTFTGHAFVDCIKKPQKALVIHKHIGFMHYLGEKPDTEETAFIADTALNYRSDRSYCNWMELAFCPDSVADIIRKTYPDLESYHRINWDHIYEEFLSGPDPITPAGCSLRFLDKKLFKNKFLRYETEMFWDSTDIFLKKVFGTVIVDANNKFMGVCGAVSDSDNFHEINIEVTKEKRRMGIGYAVAHKYIQECYRRGKVPHWDCNEHNIPSQSLAAKLGFVESGRYPLVSWTY